MISWLKKHFIPHHGNDFRPHFLHGKNAQSIVGIVLVLELLAFIVPTITFVAIVQNSNLASVLPAVLATLTNEEREHNKLPDLVVSPLLTEAAQLKADDMAKKGYFAHTSPEGITPWHWLNTVGYQYDYAGENLAINFTDSEDVTKAWMNSPTHRANIVKASYREVGTGVATGMFEGRETVFIAQVYANPKPTKTVAMAYKDEVHTQAITQSVAIDMPTENVLGAETAIPEANDKTQTIPDKVISESSDNAQVSSQNQNEPSFFERIVASPHHSFNIILYIILGIVLLALVLHTAINFNLKHPDLITNGLAVVAIIGAVFIFNNYFSNKNTSISQSVNYSFEQTQ
jgi:hypothetical protein